MLDMRSLTVAFAVVASGCGAAQTPAPTSDDAPPADAAAAVAPELVDGSPPTVDEPSWERHALESSPVFSVESPGPLVLDFSWAGDYLGRGRYFTTSAGDARYGARASRPVGQGLFAIEQALEARTAAGCTVEETPPPAAPEGLPRAPDVVRQWNVECDGVMARIRYHGFVEPQAPGRDISLVAVGAEEDDAARFLGSVHTEVAPAP